MHLIQISAAPWQIKKTNPIKLNANHNIFVLSLQEKGHRTPKPLTYCLEIPSRSTPVKPSSSWMNHLPRQCNCCNPSTTATIFPYECSIVYIDLRKPNWLGLLPNKLKIQGTCCDPQQQQHLSDMLLYPPEILRSMISYLDSRRLSVVCAANDGLRCGFLIR